MMRPITMSLAVVATAAIASGASAQPASWTPEISLGAGLGHVFRWEDQTFGDRITAGGGVAMAHRSGWAFEWHADRTFGLRPKLAPCGLVNVTCVGLAHYGPTRMAVMSMNVRRSFGDGRLQPYLTGGLGAMWSRSLHSVTQVRGSITTNSEFASNDRGFGPDLGAGLRMRVARAWSLEAEVRWLDAPWLSRQNLAVTRLLTGATYAIR
jgi:opacity protein-like surface antigen